MGKGKYKKLIGAFVTILGIAGFVLAFVSVLVREDPLHRVLERVAVTMLMIVAVLAIIFSVIFRAKDAVGIAKLFYRLYKKKSASMGNSPKDYIDPISCELNAVKEEPVRNSQDLRVNNDMRECSNVRKWFNLIMIILFLIVPFIGVILLRMNKILVGGILFGFGFIDIIMLIIVNSIADKKALSRRKYTSDERLTQLNSILSQREVVPVQLVKASVSDAEKIWEMQKIAFAELLEKYGDCETSPANEELSKVLSRFDDPNTYHYFIEVEEQKVGVIRVVDKKTEEKKRLAQIFVMPEYRRNGYAFSGIKEVEKIHGETGWELDTILHEINLIRMYRNLGYKMTAKSRRVNSQMLLIGFEK